MAWPVGIPRTLSPEQRVERARKAAQARASTDGMIRTLARRTLTDEQRERLADLLTPEAGGVA